MTCDVQYYGAPAKKPGKIKPYNRIWGTVIVIEVNDRLKNLILVVPFDDRGGTPRG